MLKNMLVAVSMAMIPGLACAAENIGFDGPAVALHATPKYGPGFDHFDYVNANAPKGGAVVTGTIGTYDSLNGFILRGVAASGLGLTGVSLMVQSADEPFSLYPGLATRIAFPADEANVTFTLRDTAKWDDGQAITVDDVVWSFNTLKTKGHPQFQAYYNEVTKAEKIGQNQVRFTFRRTGNAELPLIVAQMPILPKHYWAKRDFDKTTLEPPLGGGPYRIARFEAGRSITYERVKDWWGANLPVYKGQYNVDEIRIDYYRDMDVLFEAFKAGKVDFREENIARNWATAYDFAAVQDGRVQKALLAHQLPQGMQGFVMNQRRPLFQDIRVREALNYLFDFEWMNKNLFFNAYTRTASYFENSELAARGLPTADEIAVLEPFKAQLPPELLTKEWRNPVTDGSGRSRDNLRHALDLLQKAGWILKDGKLVDHHGVQFRFELLLSSQSFERVALAYKQSLARAGIELDVRVVDAAQYQKRSESFDFDMLIEVLGQSLSPGNEQRDYWFSTSADRTGSKNIIGVKNPVVDALVDKIITAPDRASLITRVHALDRVLLWQWYVVPNWYLGSHRVAWWDRFGRPAIQPIYGDPGFPERWWVDTTKDNALKR